MGGEELIAVTDDFNAVDTCLSLFQESWTLMNNKRMISLLAFQKAVQRCRSAMELTLHDNTKHCNAESWRYFTLMSIFSSLTGMLSLLSLYLYFKIQDKIRKKKSLEKETRVLRQQGTSVWAAAACIGGGRQRTEYTQ